MSPGIVYLIPSLLNEEGAGVMPAYLLEAIRDCQVFFVENERTTRRFFKQCWKEIVIDDYEWFRIADTDTAVFIKTLKAGKNIGIVSEAGCPGVADPGQQLVGIAQDMGAVIKPLVGPSSILLALMASGMSGQRFFFQGYLPIEPTERAKSIRELEKYSRENECTQVFIETPYRNNVLIEALIRNCQPQTRLCIAVDLTGAGESVRTKVMSEWKKSVPDIHKRPAIFLLYAGKDY